MSSVVTATTNGGDLPFEDVLTVPVVAEVFDVKTQNVEIGRVRLSTRIVEKQQLVDVPLERDEVEVERITLNQAVEHAVPVRVEGNVTIVSLYEEVAVITEQLVFKEEVRIMRRKSVQSAPPQQITLRHEVVTVTRHPASPAIWTVWQ